MPDLFPQRASTLAWEVDLLYFAWVGIAGFFSLLIFGLLLYFFVRFRRSRSQEVGRVEKTSMPLEITWSIIPLGISLVMFAWGTSVYLKLSRPPADAVEYFVTGKQWMWKVQHPTGAREINTLHVPVGVPIKLIMTSEDVIHSFFLPAFRVKRDVLPGRYTTVWFEATRRGRYRLFCAEYCGAEHSLMGGEVHVMAREEYEQWLAASPSGRPPAESGQELFAELACDTCHEPATTERAPTLAGLFGSKVLLDRGRSVVADETYLRESILEPRAKLVPGYEPRMPTYQGQVSEEEVGQLIAYIKSLSPEGRATGGM